jgi:hypothetical protein
MAVEPERALGARRPLGCSRDRTTPATNASEMVTMWLMRRPASTDAFYGGEGMMSAIAKPQHLVERRAVAHMFAALGDAQPGKATPRQPSAETSDAVAWAFDIYRVRSPQPLAAARQAGRRWTCGWAVIRAAVRHRDGS